MIERLVYAFAAGAWFGQASRYAVYENWEAAVAGSATCLAFAVLWGKS